MCVRCVRILLNIDRNIDAMLANMQGTCATRGNKKNRLADAIQQQKEEEEKKEEEKHATV